MSHKKTPTYVNRIVDIFYDVNEPQLAMHMHRPDVMHQYSMDALEMMMSVKEMMGALKQLADLRRNDPKAYALLAKQNDGDDE